jgi:hypothetical protein
LSFPFLAFSADAALWPLVQVTFIFSFRKDEFQVKQASVAQRWEVIQKNRKRKDFYFKKKSA